VAGAYGTTILDHFRRPRNHGTLAAADLSAEGSNPLCGDRIRIQLAIDGSAIVEARFTANACAICIAAASLLTEHVLGMDVAVASALSAENALGWLDADVPTARRTCALLPLETLRRALAERGAVA
jgi:nitrogen fixation NifU-like protein